MNQDAYQAARKKVKKKKDFYGHLSSFLVMSIFFFVLNMLTSPWVMWFYWPILGWGIGVLFHYFDVFGVPGVGSLDKEWEEKAIQEEMAKMQNSSHFEEDYDDQEYLNLNEMPRPQKRAEPRKDWNDSDLV
jgi:hypothetical protein